MNSIKFSSSNTTVEVKIKNYEVDQSSIFSCRVIDQGCGITTDQASTIFKPFYNSDFCDKVISDHGYGMGLNLSREIIRKMGGDLSLIPTAL